MYHSVMKIWTWFFQLNFYITLWKHHYTSQSSDIYLQIVASDMLNKTPWVKKVQWTKTFDISKGQKVIYQLSFGHLFRTTIIINVAK